MSETTVSSPAAATSHWERVYLTKTAEQVSWYQRRSSLSLALILRYAPSHNARIIDVGAGASTLSDGLLDEGYHAITVVDLSASALHASKRRLGIRSRHIDWIQSDVRHLNLPKSSFDLWHDRALFHFLTSREDRELYKERLLHLVSPNGHAVIATFAEDGPPSCSGLPVARYSARQLCDELGPDFTLLESHREEHVTPSGVGQQFNYCVFSVEPAGSV